LAITATILDSSFTIISFSPSSPLASSMVSESFESGTTWPPT